jgi:hypothetical protein
MTAFCPACHSQHLEYLFNMGWQPLSLVAMQTDPVQSGALERHQIQLVICHQCGHVHNIDFDPNIEQYSGAGCRMYNSGLLWQDHVKDIRCIIEALDVDLILEVGAGDCEFLASIDTDAVKMAVDPCEAVTRAPEGIEWVREYFVADNHIPLGAGDIVIVMRHLLEHMEHPRDLIDSIVLDAKSSRPKCNTHLLIEVPCCTEALYHCRIEDWTYEHPQHFTVNSLNQLLHNSGVDVCNIWTTYGDEVIVALCTVTGAQDKHDLDVEAVVDNYQKVYLGLGRAGAWMKENLDKIAFWGGAGKSAMFLRLFGVPDDAFVVDSHEAKWGYCVPGTQIQIRPTVQLNTAGRPIIIATTSWRANDIRDEILLKNTPCSQLLKFEGGELVEVPLGIQES